MAKKSALAKVQQVAFEAAIGAKAISDGEAVVTKTITLADVEKMAAIIPARGDGNANLRKKIGRSQELQRMIRKFEADFGVRITRQ